jgi:hypothetical protein
VPDAPDGPSVSYPIAALLDRLERTIDGLRQDVAQRFDRLERTLAAKADKADVAAVEHRVGALEAAAAEQKTAAAIARDHAAARVDWRRWIWPTLLTAAMVVLGIIQLVTHR